MILRSQILSKLPSFAATAVALLAVPAFAGSGPDAVTVDVDPLVTGGQSAQTCAWPTAVAVTSGGGLCTGTLVHPRVVTYAAHCGGGSKTITFGESAFGGAFSMQGSCQVNPNYTGVSDVTDDYAFCVLNQEVQIPVTPPLLGCELNELTFGREVAIAGFGDGGSSGGAGVKRWGLTTTQGINKGMNLGVAGGMGSPAACQGDSGGPAFVRLADGGWRVWGIVSTGTDCGNPVNYSLVAGAVPWIEQQSGIDITPCHTAEGEWDPTPSCGGFNASEPGAAFGSWSNGCVGGPVSDLASTCGPPNGAPPDETPPTVSITNPADQSTFPAPASVDIDIQAADVGWGIKEVRLLINGVDVGAVDPTAPYGFTGASFPDEGVYQLAAVAVDYAGLETISETVNIGVGDAEPPPSETTGTSTSAGGEDSGSGDTGGEAGTGETGVGAGDEGGGDSGCACDVRDESGAGWGALGMFGMFGMFGVVGRRRRRRA